jgi:hypothetical protein
MELAYFVGTVAVMIVSGIVVTSPKKKVNNGP